MSTAKKNEVKTKPVVDVVPFKGNESQSKNGFIMQFIQKREKKWTTKVSFLKVLDLA